MTVSLRCMTSGGCREEGPFAGHALQRPVAAWIELEARSSHEILGGARGPHFTRTSLGLHARGEVHGDATDVVAHQLHFAGMESRANLESERLHLRGDRQRAPNRAAGPVETRHHPVARGVRLAAAKSHQLVADN